VDEDDGQIRRAVIILHANTAAQNTFVRRR
jgi:hypothetical protein